jgi:basic amino acid/polyamine antiporter, APA family
MKERPLLIRGLNVWDAGALVVGCVIGAGIFRLSDSVAKASPSPFMFLLAWALGGLLSLCGALCYAELATRFPRTGGDYVFLTEAYGRRAGFLFGWTKLFVQRTGTIAIIAFVFAEHAARVFGAGPETVKPVASAAIVALTLANVAGLGFGKGIQNVFTFLKVAAILLIVAVGLLAGEGSWSNFTPFWPEWSPGLISSTGVALIFVLWTYGGWENAAYVAEEVKDPRRNLPRSIVGGLLVATGLYLLVNVVYLYYLPLSEMRATDLVAAGAMERVRPGFGGRAVAAMVMASTFGALNGFILAGGRILLALSRDHALFEKLAHLPESTRTPAYALLCNGAIALLLVWTGTLDQIVTYTEIVIYLFFTATGVSLFVFRKREGAGDDGSYRVWGYPWTPAVFILMCFAFAVNAVIEQPKESLLGFAVAALGLPLYALSERLKKSSG